MIDIRPVANIVGKLVVTLGAAMALPMVVDWWHGDPHWMIFLETGLLTMLAGAVLALSTRQADKTLSIHQVFLLTALLWLVLPLAGAVPFMLGAPHAGFTDAYFEAMSGFTTTGATAFPSLDDLPKGTNLWRVFLNWSGGLGIIVVAMIFLPVMKVGGMQFFRSEGFDTLGKILPRAFDIAREMTWVYIALTAVCMVVYILLGMTGFDALVLALSTCSTGGFSNYDSSFGPYIGTPEYAASFFMILASIPFIRMVQLIRGSAVPLWRDVQVRAYIRWMFYAIAVIVIYRIVWLDAPNPPEVIRETIFNVISTFSGTGLSSTDVTQWGHLPFVILIVAGLIGGCTGSTSCSVKVFRYLVLIEAVKTQLRRMQSPHRIFPLLYGGQPLEQDVVDSVMAFFTLFILSFGVLIVGLAMTGLHPRTAVTGAWTAIANVGVMWGPELSGNGAVDGFPTAAKWIIRNGYKWVTYCCGFLSIFNHHFGYGSFQHHNAVQQIRHKNRRECSTRCEQDIICFPGIIRPFGAIHQRAALQSHFVYIVFDPLVCCYPSYFHREVYRDHISFLPFTVDGSISIFQCVGDGYSIYFDGNLVSVGTLEMIQFRRHGLVPSPSRYAYQDIAIHCFLWLYGE